MPSVQFFHPHSALSGSSKLRQPGWKWVAGSGAVVGTAAAVPATLAGTVQITLTGEQVTSSGSTLTRDLTNDGNQDVGSWIPISSTFQLTSTPRYGYSVINRYAAGIVKSPGTELSQLFAVAAYQTFFSSGISGAQGYYVQIGGVSNFSSSNILSLSGLIPFTFSDSRINSGFTTNAFAEIRAFNTNKTTHTVQVVRTIFDDSSTTAPGDAVAGGTYPEWVAPEPDINVLGNGNSIADGDTTPSVTDGTDFGSTQVGSTVVRTFTVVNEGTANLSVTSIVSSLVDFTFNFDNFGTGEFDVLFTPSSTGEQTATITIENDDPDEGTYTFDVVGVGTAVPVPTVAPATNPNAVLQASFQNKIKKLKKKLKKVKASGNSGSAKKLKKKLKKLKKKLKAVS